MWPFALRIPNSLLWSIRGVRLSLHPLTIGICLEQWRPDVCSFPVDSLSPYPSDNGCLHSDWSNCGVAISKVNPVWQNEIANLLLSSKQLVSETAKCTRSNYLPWYWNEQRFHSRQSSLGSALVSQFSWLWNRFWWHSNLLVICFPWVWSLSSPISRISCVASFSLTNNMKKTVRLNENDGNCVLYAYR